MFPVITPPSATHADPGRDAMEVADRIGARLVRDAFCAGERCNWVGASMEPVDGSWTVVHRALEADLYAGTSGVALFLAALFAKTRRSSYRQLALGAALNSLDRAAELSAHPGSVFSGRLGVGYAVWQAGQLLDDPSLVARARALLLDASQAPPDASALDLIGGSAGAVGVLLAAHRYFGDDWLLQAAVRHGEHLVTAGMVDDNGEMSWDTLPGQTQRPLTGLAHGAAGIVLALGELASWLHDRRFRDAALAGARYENRWFNAQQDNWPDFRLLNATANADGSASCGLAWCHGAPGIGLQRLRDYLATGNSRSRDEALAAGRAVTSALQAAAQRMPGDVSLCHGLGSLIELLMELGRAKLAPETEALARNSAIALASTFDASHRGFPCGVPEWPGEVPGLMLGLAGIGGMYLRLADASAFPLLLLPGIELCEPAERIADGASNGAHVPLHASP